MPFPLAAWVPTAIAAGASLIGGFLQNKGQRSAAREQMDFQKEMSNTAYRRARNDLEASGYSPYLAYGQGGATTPGGAQANVSDVIGPAVSSAMAAKSMTHNLRLIDRQERVQAMNQNIGEMEWYRLKQLYGAETGNVVPGSALDSEIKTAAANKRVAEAEASNAEFENTETRRWQRIMFGNQGYIPGVGGAVGSVIGGVLPFGRFKNAGRLIQGIKGRGSINSPGAGRNPNDFWGDLPKREYLPGGGYRFIK